MGKNWSKKEGAKDDVKGKHDETTRGACVSIGQASKLAHDDDGQPIIVRFRCSLLLLTSDAIANWEDVVSRWNSFSLAMSLPLFMLLAGKPQQTTIYCSVQIQAQGAKVAETSRQYKCA